MVVSNIFYVHTYLGKIPILTNIFEMASIILKSRNNPTTKTTARASDTIVFLGQDTLEANLLSMERGKTSLNQNKNT